MRVYDLLQNIYYVCCKCACPRTLADCDRPRPAKKLIGWSRMILFVCAGKFTKLHYSQNVNILQKACYLPSSSPSPTWWLWDSTWPCNSYTVQVIQRAKLVCSGTAWYEFQYIALYLQACTSSIHSFVFSPWKRSCKLWTWCGQAISDLNGKDSKDLIASISSWT